MKALPIGIQSFADLRNKGYLYVDKTEHIHRLITSGKTYFLSRPRRFGKSLLVTTLAEVFKGNKNLFEGLHIYDRYDWTEQYPVIRIDWSNISHASAGEMEIDMMAYLDVIASNNQISLIHEYASSRFFELIKRIHELTGKQVVILIDEYDMPILEALNQPDNNIRKEIREFMQSFYKILKSADEHLRFVFLTGVSKFAKVSIFSGLNNLNDITFDTKYATICGYTQTELESCFDGYIEHLTRQKKTTKPEILESIKQWYNGYSWDAASSVYNPFSTLLLFDKNTFGNYWFSSGTPTFLINLIRERNDVEAILNPVLVSSSGFDSTDAETMETTQLMFQTGYLTVKKIEDNPFGGTPDYTLGIPNQEVYDSLLSHLFADFSGYSLLQTEPMRDRLRRQLLNADEEGFVRNMREMFAHIPYQLHIPREAYYHSLLLLWLKMLGFEVQGEISTDKGRIDALWIWKNHAVVAELKYQPVETDHQGTPEMMEKLLDAAMSQIRNLRYYDRYAANYQVTLAAIAFTGKEIGCRMKKI